MIFFKFNPVTNKILCQTKAHSMPITNISCTVSITSTTPELITFSSKNIIVLTVSKLETKLFDLDSLKLRHTLEYSENSLIAIHVAFIPNNDKIFSCFSDDTIHIWNQNTMEPITQFSPFKNFNNPTIKKSPIENLKMYENLEDNETYMHQYQQDNENFPNGRIRAVCFANSGENVCISTIDNLLVFMNIEIWQIVKIVCLIDLQVKNISYITYSDLENIPSSNATLHQQLHQYLLIHATNGDIVFFNVNNINTKMIINQKNSYKMYVNSRNASIFGVILSSGEILIEKSDFYVSSLENYQRSLVYHKENRQGIQNSILLERVFKDVSTNFYYY